MKGRMLLATAVALMMVVTVMPLSDISTADAAQAAYTAADVEGSDLPALAFVDNGDGSYTMQSEYLESVFGIKDAAPSDIDDPIGNNPVGISPLELVYWYGGADSTYEVHEISSGENIRVDHTNINTDSNHSISFAAALTQNNADAHKAPGTRWDESGFAKQDWYCNLYYDNGTGELKLAVMNGVDSSVVSVDAAGGTGPYPLDQINIVTSIQSTNILDYAVGDFDGDGNEDIAVHHITNILVFSLDQSTLQLELRSSTPVPSYSGYHNTLFTPVSMSSGDVDDDGVDELVVARGYYKDGIAGNSEFTDIGVVNYGDSMGATAKWVRMTVHDPKNSSSMLDSVMTSVACADIDNDGRTEIVVGGFLWDNTNTDVSYTKNWNHSAGELYLTYLEYSEMSSSVNPRGLTILGDDNGTASTRYLQDNKDFSKHYAMNGHDLADTSIFLTDNSDNPSGLCRSPNWCNWTVPLYGGSMSGPENGRTHDQAYFDKWFYEYRDGSFKVYKKVSELGKVMDNNNVACHAVNIGSILNQDPENYSARDDFMVFYAADLQSNFDNGDTEWVFVVYSYSDNPECAHLYSVNLTEPYRDLRGWGLYNVGRAFVGNYDNDTYYVDYMARLFTYTDPTVIAVLEAVPYDMDLADILLGGADAIGKTSFTKYDSHTESVDSTCHFEIGPSGGLDAIVKAEAAVMMSHDKTFSSSNTLQFSSSYTSSHDTVAAYVIPTDMYFHKVYVPSGTGYTESYQYVPTYRDPVQTMFDREEYNEFITNYNGLMADLSSDFVDLPTIPSYGVEEGDVTTYTGKPTDPLQQRDVYYKGAGNSATVHQEVDLSKSTGEAYAGGGYVDVSIQASLFFGIVNIGGSMQLGGTRTTTSTDLSGMAFSSDLYNGMQVNYLGNVNEAKSVLSQYTMTGSIWAEMRQLTDEHGNVNEYVHVGYTVTNHTSAAKLASIVPDVYIPDGTDEDDPYNPTNDSICLQVTLPGLNERPDMNADGYRLQVKWQNNWYTINGSVLGFGVYVGSVTDGWESFDGTLYPEPEDRTVWVKVDGLSAISNNSVDFRIESYRTAGTVEEKNPSLPVTGYKDTRVSGANHMVTAGRPMVPDHITLTGADRNFIVVGPESFKKIDEHIVLFLKTELSEGDRADLWYCDRDLNFSLLSEDLLIYADGYMIYEYVPEPETDSGPVLVAGSVILVLLSAMLLVSAFRKR